MRPSIAIGIAARVALCLLAATGPARPAAPPAPALQVSADSLAGLIQALSDESSGGNASAAPGSILFGTVFDALQDTSVTRKVDAGRMLRPRLETFAARARAFHSRLSAGSQRPGPESALMDERRHLEKDLVVLIATVGIEDAAADYARQAVLLYEWEGLTESPLQEAAFASEYLKLHPGTALRPYLQLFLAHRWRCAAETLRRDGDSPTRKQAEAEYGLYLRAALKDADPLVRLVAADMKARPFLYLDERSARPAPAPAEEVETSACPDTALPGLVGDPRAWATRCFALSAGPEGPRQDSLTELRADIFAGDAAPALLIGSLATTGNAGGPHCVFRPEGTAFRYVGSLFLHPRAFKVLPPTEEGRPRMLRYVRLGAGEGLLETVVHDGRAFVVARSEKVYPQGADAAKLCELFGLMCPEDSAGRAGRGPSLPLQRALALANVYVRSHRVDLTGQHLNATDLRYDEVVRERYWDLRWAWSRPRLGGEFGLHVYMSGTIVPAILGP
jgi:hypothetical protein